jgi:hypothetical protein
MGSEEQIAQLTAKLKELETLIAQQAEAPAVQPGPIKVTIPRERKL